MSLRSAHGITSAGPIIGRFCAFGRMYVAIVLLFAALPCAASDGQLGKASSGKSTISVNILPTFKVTTSASAICVSSNSSASAFNLYAYTKTGGENSTHDKLKYLAARPSAPKEVRHCGPDHSQFTTLTVSKSGTVVLIPTL